MPSMVVPCLAGDHTGHGAAWSKDAPQLARGNPANERICRHIIKLENLREELPPLLKRYNLEKARWVSYSQMSGKLGK